MLWSTGTSVVFCPSEGSSLMKTHSSTKASLNESPTGNPEGFHGQTQPDIGYATTKAAPKEVWSNGGLA